MVVCFSNMFVCIQLSWSKSLKNRFKNVRRVPRSEHSGLHFAPPPKKRCLNHNWTNDSGRCLDDVTYRRHVSSLKRDYERKRTCTESIMIRMQETAATRRLWIQKERPTVQTILVEFPYLKSYIVVSLCLFWCLVAPKISFFR